MSLSLKPIAAFTKQVVQETATLTWATDGLFRTSYRILSPQFSPPDSINVFELSFNFPAVSKLRSSFELTYKGPQMDRSFYYRLSIVDAECVKHYTKEARWDYKKSRNVHRGNTLCMSYLSGDICRQFLVNRILRFHCEVDILGESDLPPQTQLESFGELSENYETLLQSGKWADFVLMIGDKQFCVHKTILAARSPVFAAMFEHAETKEVKQGRAVIEDVGVEVFELMIRYIYTAKVDTFGGHAAELFVAADKYQLSQLKSICEQSLIFSISTHSVCGLLLSDLPYAEQLNAQCIEYMLENAQKVMQTEGWKQLLVSTRIDLVAQMFEKLAIGDA